jgi:Domain of unknown function (DUF4328)
VNSEFKPLATRAKWTVALLAVAIAVDAFAVFSDIREIQLMNRLIEGDFPSLDELDASDTRQGIAGLLELATLIAVVVAFLMWFSRAYKNLAALGATGFRFTPGWAVGAWFVPILNLWRPKQIANDIWRASDPAAPPEQGSAWRDRATPAVLTIWWIVWIFSGYLGNLTTRLAFEGDGATDVRDADYADLGALVLDAAAAVLAIVVVRSMTRRLDERAANLAGMAQTPVGPAVPPPADAF